MVTCVCCGKPLLDGRPDALMEDGPAHFRAMVAWRDGSREQLAADRDRLRAECEKAQAERDEALAEVRRLRTTLRMEMETDGIPIASAVDPDPTSASRLPELPERTDDNAPLLRYAADIMERTNGVAPCIRESIAALRQRASNLEAVAAREQERDALIEKALDILDGLDSNPSDRDIVTALADAGLLRPDDRNERSEK